MAKRFRDNSGAYNKILLWLLIHGGDPVPDAIRNRATLEAISALAATLKNSPAGAQIARLASGASRQK